MAPVGLLQLCLVAAATVAHVTDQPQRLRRLEHSHLLKVERVEEGAACACRVDKQVVPRVHLRLWLGPVTHGVKASLLQRREVENGAREVRVYAQQQRHLEEAVLHLARGEMLEVGRGEGGGVEHLEPELDEVCLDPLPQVQHIEPHKGVA